MLRKYIIFKEVLNKIALKHDQLKISAFVLKNKAY